VVIDGKELCFRHDDRTRTVLSGVLVLLVHEHKGLLADHSSAQRIVDFSQGLAGGATGRKRDTTGGGTPKIP
jgi:hypothetical protein